VTFIDESVTQGGLVSDAADDEESGCFIASLTEYNVTPQLIVSWIRYGEIFQLEINTYRYFVVGDPLICSWHEKFMQGCRIGSNLEGVECIKPWMEIITECVVTCLSQQQFSDSVNDNALMKISNFSTHV
jgi:hypothetical protein